jgi:hypothetical protein
VTATADAGIQVLPRQGRERLRSHADVLNHVSRYQAPLGHDPRSARGAHAARSPS